MSEFKKVNTLEYVKEGLQNGTLIPRKAEKFARIAAREAKDGEEVISWSVDANGNPIKEKVATAEEGSYVVTKLDENHDVIIDNNGHVNEWIIDGTTFKKKYEVDPEDTTVYRPTGGVQIFVQISEDIIVEQWGSEMKIARGGYINITNADDMYAISERDFNDTYKFVDEAPTKKLNNNNQ